MMQMNCPTCLEPIEPDRVIQNKAYCNCGQVVSLSDSGERARETVLLRRAFGMIAAAAVILFHMISWGNHSFEIIPLKLKQMVGIASVENLQSIASICDDRKKWNCEIDAYSQLFAKNETHLAYLADLAAVQAAHGEQTEASSNYQIYFRLGGRDRSVRFAYAKLLADTGDSVDAKRQFSYLVNLKHHKPQFEVAREYVHFLMKNHDYPTAKTIISSYRRTGPTASMFLNQEWVQINDQLKVNSSRSPAAVN